MAAERAAALQFLRGSSADNPPDRCRDFVADKSFQQARDSACGRPRPWGSLQGFVRTPIERLLTRDNAVLYHACVKNLSYTPSSVIQYGSWNTNTPHLKRTDPSTSRPETTRRSRRFRSVIAPRTRARVGSLLSLRFAAKLTKLTHLISVTDTPSSWTSWLRVKPKGAVTRMNRVTSITTPRMGRVSAAVRRLFALAPDCRAIAHLRSAPHR
jgi:hypothetical protein